MPNPYILRLGFSIVHDNSNLLQKYCGNSAIFSAAGALVVAVFSVVTSGLSGSINNIVANFLNAHRFRVSVANRSLFFTYENLNMNVIAEGVETDAQRQLLRNKGCAHYQGYLFGKPMPIEQFDALLKQDFL